MEEKPRLLTRRAMLRVTTRGALAWSLAPQLLRGSESASDFRFAVANDLHYRDERCRAWFAQVTAVMRAQRPDFVVLNGDLVENGQAEQYEPVREIFRNLGVPVYATIGNHDHRGPEDIRAFAQAFPDSLNYHFKHRGWQFVAVDSTQGQDVFLTKVAPATLQWLDETLPALDRNKPTVLLTHFPLGSRVWCRPRNAPQVLRRFRGYNLQAVFNGHWHGFTERAYDRAPVVTNRCCSWWRPNNDHTPEKGYFLCTARAGRLVREFCEIKPAEV